MIQLLNHADWRAICTVATPLFLQSSLVLVTGLSASWIIRIRAAALRSAILRATLGAVIAAPLVAAAINTLGVRGFDVAVPWPQIPKAESGADGILASPQSTAAAPVSTTPAPAISDSVLRHGGQTVMPSPSQTQDHFINVNAYAVWGIVWFSVTALLALRILIANILLAFTRLSARPASDLIWQSCHKMARELGVKLPQLLISRHFTTPCLVGWLRPAILLPYGTTDVGDEILLHELAHIKRHDCLWQLLARMTVAALWFQPLAWVLARELERTAEEACDDFVLTQGGDRTAYARRLVEFAEASQPRVLTSAAALGVVSFRSNIAKRIVRLLDDSRTSKARLGRLRIAAIALALLLIVGVGGLVHVREYADAAQPDRYDEFGGDVLGSEGKAVAGAELYLFGSVPPDNKAVLVARGSTNANGHFSLRADRPLSKEIGVNLTIHAKGYGLSGGFVHRGDNNHFTLESPAKIRLTFVDEASQPVPNLRVTITALASAALPFHWIAVYPPVSDLLAGQTDEFGAITLADLPAGYQFRPQISDERFAQPSYSDRVVLSAGPTSAPHTVVVRRAGAITGRVSFSPTGVPAGGLTVVARADHRLELSMSGGTGTTGADGTYRIPQLVAGSYRVSVFPSEQLSRQWAFPVRESIEVVVGQATADVDLALTGGAILTGKVSKSDTGEPVTDVDIGVNTPFIHDVDGRTYAEFVHRARTNATGTYLVHVPPGSYFVVFNGRFPDGYQPYAARNQKLPDWGAGHEVTVVDGQTATVDVPLFPSPGRPVSGMVVDETGKPVANAGVTAEATEDINRDEEGHTTTDAAGHFHLRAILPYSLLRAGKDGLATAAPTEVNGGETDIALRLVPGTVVTVSGIVTDAANKPVEKVAVVVMEWHGNGYTEAGAIYTDASGHFTLRNISTSRRYTLRAGDGKHFTKSVDLHLVPGRANEVVIKFE